ncbi:MAG: hypothetical protein QF712_05670 [Candidatus Marinimicrobia bacterium]|nr:hypothetical protein [Candidatus Neomarinimicrobiota bacterium]
MIIGDGGMSNLTKLENMEKICLSITKDNIDPYALPPDEMMDHIIGLMDGNGPKQSLIEKLIVSMHEGTTDEKERQTFFEILDQMVMDYGQGSGLTF